MSILNNLKNRDFFIERKLIVYFFGKALSSIVTLASIPLFIKWFGDENYGNYIVAYTTFLIFLSGTLGWLNHATIKHYGEYKDDEDFEIKIKLIVSRIFIFGSILLSLILLLSKQIEYSTLPFIIIAYLFSCFYTNELVFTKVKYKAKKYAISEFLRLSSGFLVIFLIKNLNFLDAEKKLFIGIMVSFIIGFLYISNGTFLPFKKLLNTEFDKSLFKKFLIYGIPIGIWMAMSPSSNGVDRYVLNSYLGAVAVAQYTAVYDVIFKVFTQLSTPIATIIQPMLMNFYNEGNMASFKKTMNKSVVYLSLLFIPVFFIVNYFGDYILSNYLGFKDEQVLKDLKMTIIPIALSSFIWQLAILIQRRIEATGKSYLVTILMIIAILFSAIMSYIIIPIYGYAYLGYVALVTSIFYFLLILFLNKKIK
ncbi:lipopolysaccharide biosynthesis protein [Olleya namhaensis]|uniref:lipopolysaccharide biosynthesis protein n=1 Tax=Olleya namhaensis TaxID=1144750 RepID=UPI0024916AAB|nr:MATE family efflux transporter [Olleya namhaensis]